MLRRVSLILHRLLHSIMNANKEPETKAIFSGLRKDFETEKVDRKNMKIQLLQTKYLQSITLLIYTCISVFYYYFLEFFLVVMSALTNVSNILNPRKRS